MGHVDLKSMEPYQHQDLEPLREAINQRNLRKKVCVQVFLAQVLENGTELSKRILVDICLMGLGLRWWTRKESNLQPVD